MGINFRTETFRDDFTFRNSPEHIRRFPFPFHEDSYMYAVNIEPHVPGPKGSVLENLIDVDEHYVSEMADRALVLAEDPLRCQSLPHMTLAGWDLLELLMTEQAAGYPEHFSLTRDGDNWHWINRPLDIDQKFVFGDLTTLPCGPMEYITRQSQGDFCLLDQRDGNLWMDAGIVTTQADWSLDFDIGMNFFEWHAPVPLAHEKGIFTRALKFLTNIQQGKPARRLNWTMTINPRLDTSPENYHKWGPDRTTVTPENVGQKVHLRVELQSFWRLPRSNGLVFPIRCYLIKMDELVTSPKWARRLHRVIRDLPEELATYKGLTRYPPDAGRMAVEIRRRLPDEPRVWAGLSPTLPSPRGEGRSAKPIGVRVVLRHGSPSSRLPRSQAEIHPPSSSGLSRGSTDVGDYQRHPPARRDPRDKPEDDVHAGVPRRAPLPSPPRPGLLDRREEKRRRQPEQDQPVDRLHGAEQHPLPFQVDLGMAVAGHRAQRIEHRRLEVGQRPQPDIELRPGQPLQPVQRGGGDRQQPDRPDEAVVPVPERRDLRHQRPRDQHERRDMKHDRRHHQRQAVLPVGCPHGLVSRRRASPVQPYLPPCGGESDFNILAGSAAKAKC